MNADGTLTGQELFDRQDPRVFASVVFQDTSGIPGDTLLLSASTTTKFGGNEVAFALPSHAALCLNLSHEAYKKAQNIPEVEFFQKESSRYMSQEGLPLLFDLFEQLFLNIIFAYTALEAFTNETIPNGYVFSQLRSDKKCQESYDRDQMERSLSLDVKLLKVLPEITGIKLNSGGKLWEGYGRLKKIRDRIIHVKAADMGLAEDRAKNIWTDLLDQRKYDASEIAHRIIQHFLIQHPPASSPVAEGRNRWVSRFPFP